MDKLDYWQKHLQFLETKYPEHLEDIVHARFQILSLQNPELATHYNSLNDKLNNQINAVWKDNSEFGFDHAQAITRQFLIDNDFREWIKE